MSQTYNEALIGGTFDILHDGHKRLLDKSLSIAYNVIIGLTSDIYIMRYKSGNPFCKSFEQRKKNLIVLLMYGMNVEKRRFSIIPIDNPSGFLLNSINIENKVVVVSEESLNRMLDINAKRDKDSKFDILCIPNVIDADGKRVSSTRIRNGECDRSLYLPGLGRLD